MPPPDRGLTGGAVAPEKLDVEQECMARDLQGMSMQVALEVPLQAPDHL